MGGDPTGMAAFWTALTAEITADKLWAVLAGGVAMIGIAVLFAFGYRMVRRLTSGVSRGKVKA